MKRWTPQGASLSELEAHYAETTASQGQAADEGDSRKANALYKLLYATWRELKERGEEGRAVLSRLLENGNPQTRVWAAYHVLEFDPLRAEAELERIAGGPPSPVRLSTEMTLQEWRAGRLLHR